MSMQERRADRRAKAPPPKASAGSRSDQSPAWAERALTLQRLAGNAVTRSLIVQRTIGDGHDLRSNRFAKNVALEAAYDGERTIGPGSGPW